MAAVPRQRALNPASGFEKLENGADEFPVCRRPDPSKGWVPTRVPSKRKAPVLKPASGCRARIPLRLLRPANPTPSPTFLRQPPQGWGFAALSIYDLPQPFPTYPSKSPTAIPGPGA